MQRTDRFIIWDFDGTLGQRDPMWSGALLEVLRAHGYGASLSTSDIRPFLATGFRWHSPHVKNAPRTPAEQWWSELEPVFERAFYEGAGIAPPVARRLAKEVRGTYTNPQQWGLFPDTQEVLTGLSKSGWQHVLLTNHVPELGLIIQALDIQRHFVAVFNSAETGIEKPNPEAFENVRASLPSGSKPWMVGDSYTADVQGAEAVGIPAVLVRKAHPEAKRYAKDLGDLITILQNRP